MNNYSSEYDCQQNNELLTGPDEWTRCIVILKGKYFIFQLQDEPKSIADQQSMVNFDYNSSLKGKFICFLLDQTCKVHINEKYENSFIFRAVSKSYIFEDYSSLMNMINSSNPPQITENANNNNDQSNYQKFTFKCKSNADTISIVMSIRAHGPSQAGRSPLSISMFRPIKDLGSGKYGKVKLCQKKIQTKFLQLKASENINY